MSRRDLVRERDTGRRRDNDRDRDHDQDRRRLLREAEPKKRRSGFDLEASCDEVKRPRRAADPEPGRSENNGDGKFRRHYNEDLKQPLPESESNHAFSKTGANLQLEGIKELPDVRRGISDNNRKIEGPAQVPRSRSYFQHDERNAAGQGGRLLPRRATHDRRWRDPKDLRERAANPHHGRPWGHDGFFEQQRDLPPPPPPPPRKRPAFREKKADAYQEDIILYRQHGARRSEGVSRGSFPAKERYFNMNREGFDGGRGSWRGDRWKHDLFEETNRSPAARNEEDQIAKVEELLAS